MWIAISIGASVSQVARNLVTRNLSREVSAIMNSWARFSFNLPFSAVLCIILYFVFGRINVSISVFYWALFGAVSQLIANITLAHAYRYTTFGEVSIFTKLEAIFGAFLGVLFFSEFPTSQAWMGIFVSFAGIVIMNASKEGCGYNQALKLNSGSVLAAGTGFLWALSCYFIKNACKAQSLANPEMAVGVITSSVVVLFIMTAMQVFALSIYLFIFEKNALQDVKQHCRSMIALGMFSFLASICWFSAYNMTLVSYARAIGNLESVLSIVVSVFLGEKEIIRQIPGAIVVLSGVLLVMLA